LSSFDFAEKKQSHQVGVYTRKAVLRAYLIIYLYSAVVLTARSSLSIWKVKVTNHAAYALEIG